MEIAEEQAGAPAVQELGRTSEAAQALGAPPGPSEPSLAAGPAAPSMAAGPAAPRFCPFYHARASGDELCRMHAANFVLGEPAYAPIPWRETLEVLGTKRGHGNAWVEQDFMDEGGAMPIGLAVEVHRPWWITLAAGGEMLAALLARPGAAESLIDPALRRMIMYSYTHAWACRGEHDGTWWALDAAFASPHLIANSDEALLANPRVRDAANYGHGNAGVVFVARTDFALKHWATLDPLAFPEPQREAVLAVVNRVRKAAGMPRLVIEAVAAGGGASPTEQEAEDVDAAPSADTGSSLQPAEAAELVGGSSSGALRWERPSPEKAGAGAPAWAGTAKDFRPAERKFPSFQSKVIRFTALAAAAAQEGPPPGADTWAGNEGWPEARAAMPAEDDAGYGDAEEEGWPDEGVEATSGYDEEVEEEYEYDDEEEYEGGEHQREFGILPSAAEPAAAPPARDLGRFPGYPGRAFPEERPRGGSRFAHHSRSSSSHAQTGPRIVQVPAPRSSVGLFGVNRVGDEPVRVNLRGALNLPPPMPKTKPLVLQGTDQEVLAQLQSISHLEGLLKRERQGAGAPIGHLFRPAPAQQEKPPSVLGRSANPRAVPSVIQAAKRRAVLGDRAGPQHGRKTAGPTQQDAFRRLEEIRAARQIQSVREPAPQPALQRNTYATSTGPVPHGSGFSTQPAPQALRPADLDDPQVRLSKMQQLASMLPAHIVDAVSHGDRRLLPRR